jgi:hypothetical protein
MRWAIAATVVVVLCVDGWPQTFVQRFKALEDDR